MGFLSDTWKSTTSAVTGFIPGVTGQTAAEAATQAAETQAEAQMAALEYYQQANEQAQAMRDYGLGEIGALYGYGGADPAAAQTQLAQQSGALQDTLVQQALSSPVYETMMAGQQAGEEAIGRSAAATGGLRSGGTLSDIGSYATNLQQQAFLTSLGQQQQAYDQYLGGLQGLSQLPSTASQTAQMIAAPGITTAAGQLASGQAHTDAYGNILGAASGGIMAMSDMRMKENITMLSETSHPEINLYEWDWRSESGKEGKETGFIAQEVEKVWPELVVTGSDGIKRIHKEKIEEKLKWQ